MKKLREKQNEGGKQWQVAKICNLRKFAIFAGCEISHTAKFFYFYFLKNKIKYKKKQIFFMRETKFFLIYIYIYIIKLIKIYLSLKDEIPNSRQEQYLRNFAGCEILQPEKINFATCEN